MPLLTATIAAGGFLTLPMAGNGALSAIQLQGPARLDIEYVGTFPVPVIIAATGPAIAMGSFMLLSGDHRVGSPKTRCQANEVAIGMVLPISAIEIMRQRLTRAAFSRAVSMAATFTGAEAVAAGWLDEIVEVENVLRPDEPRPSWPRDRVLAEAPDSAADGFRVPTPGR